jgi:hypothetical protein
MGTSWPAGSKWLAWPKRLARSAWLALANCPRRASGKAAWAPAGSGARAEWLWGGALGLADMKAQHSMPAWALSKDCGQKNKAASKVRISLFPITG